MCEEHASLRPNWAGIRNRHGDKKGHFPQTRKAVAHGKPKSMDARDCVVVRASVKAGRHGAKVAIPAPARVREVFEPLPPRQEVSEADRAKARQWRKLSAEAYALTGMR